MNKTSGRGAESTVRIDSGDEWLGPGKKQRFLRVFVNLSAPSLLLTFFSRFIHIRSRRVKPHPLQTLHIKTRRPSGFFLSWIWSSTGRFGSRRSCLFTNRTLGIQHLGQRGFGLRTLLRHTNRGRDQRDQLSLTSASVAGRPRLMEFISKRSSVPAITPEIALSANCRRTPSSLRGKSGNARAKASKKR